MCMWRQGANQKVFLANSSVVAKHNLVRTLTSAGDPWLSNFVASQASAERAAKLSRSRRTELTAPAADAKSARGPQQHGHQIQPSTFQTCFPSVSCNSTKMTLARMLSPIPWITAS
jgi:hypothetical protein